MIVAHLGSHVGQQGGPPGYLLQLQRAFAAFGTGTLTVLLPETRPASHGRPEPSFGERVVRQLRRVRNHVSAPTYFRPSYDDVVRPGGAAHEMMSHAWAQMQAEIEPSLQRALEADADVLFAHDAPSADAALARRRAGQEVWLFMHTPMPLALYLTWCWGIPETDWRAVAGVPDVRQWIDHETAIVRAVDRVWLPCPEAHGEFARVDAGLARALERAEYLMTGGVGPPRVWPDASSVELRRRFGLPPSVPVALYLGNAQPYRGLDALLAAIKLLPPPAATPGIVAVAGPAIESMPLARRLRALGPIREVGDLMAAADAIINVNRFSLFDLSTIEALEAGRPLLLHATGGNRAFARLGAGAISIDSLDPQSIAEALVRLFTMTDAERTELAQQSRACYDAHTTLRQLGDRHLRTYAEAGRTRVHA